MSQKKTRFLFEGILTTPQESSLYHRGRIKITSPDQFVPLYLANYGEEAFPERNTKGIRPVNNPHFSREWMYAASDAAGRMTTLLGGVRDNVVAREEFKSIATTEMKRILTTKLPTEYTLSSLRGANHGTYGSLGRSSQFLEAFTEFTLGGAMMVSGDYNFLIGLGLAATISAPAYASKQTSLYPSRSYNLPYHVIIPELVTLVKYKYLAGARASIFLRQPMEIPYDGIKLMRLASFRSSKINELYVYNIGPMIQQSGMQMEYVTSEEMEKYLFPPKLKKTRAAYLEDAKKALSQEVPHVIF